MALRYAATNESHIHNSTPQYAVNWSLEGTNSANHLWIPQISRLMHFFLPLSFEYVPLPLFFFLAIVCTQSDCLHEWKWGGGKGVKERGFDF